MGIRSKVALLPEPVRAELEQRIVQRAFSGYQDLAEWLQGQGYHIAHDSVQRYGAAFKRRLDAMALTASQAEALAAAGHRAGDSSDTLVDVTIRLIQHKVLALLLHDPDPQQPSDHSAADHVSVADKDQQDRHTAQAANAAPETERGLGVPGLSRLSRMTTELARLIMARQRHAQAADSQPPTSTDGEKAGGLSEKTYHAIRNDLLGIKSSASDSLPGSGSDIGGSNNAAAAVSTSESREPLAATREATASRGAAEPATRQPARRAGHPESSARPPRADSADGTRRH